ncbi:HNH endonuclease [Bacillus alveayuensis]|jgi:site-specific recombinase XerD|uniref:phage lytic cycle repressor MrpR family protein n=1 Tax=Aeribacillus alveayuensis TaxID=279215 RepID=UPI0005CD02ED|nr:HNH endonuclease [Bacillus alveayuensis]
MDMYNPDLKEDFLSTYEENTRQRYRYAFVHTYPVEKKYGKDLKDFEEPELHELLIRRAKKATIRTFQNFFSVINQYIQWTINNKHKNSDFNPMSIFKTKDYEEYVDKNKMFISEEELNEIEDMLDNDQDKVILRLLFEGVKGEGDSELLNLKESDVDFENQQLKLRDKKGRERILHLEGRDRCFSILKRAINEKTYYAKGRDKPKKVKRGVSEYKLMETDYVIKNIIAPRTKEPNNWQTIQNRMKFIKEITGMYSLTVTDVWRSGMIRKAVELYRRDGELTTVHLEEIAEHFGTNISVNNGYKGYNCDYLRDYIKPEIISNLYRIDVGVIKNTQRTKVVKVEEPDKKKINSIKKFSIDERAKVIYEFLHNGTVDEKVQSVIEFYSVHANHKAQFPDVTLEKVIEGLQEFNERELEELDSENEEQFEKIYHVIMNEKDGSDVFRIIKTRVGQYKLRKILLQNYQFKCAMCDISQPKLLVTSHIKPWAHSSSEERVDPRNAILLCKLHDALFENGFISLSDEYKILFSPNFNFVGQGIQTNISFKKPFKDAPSPVFLKEHRQKHGYEQHYSLT